MRRMQTVPNEERSSMSWVRMTPLGLEVLPDVNMMSDMPMGF